MNVEGCLRGGFERVGVGVWWGGVKEGEGNKVEGL